MMISGDRIIGSTGLSIGTHLMLESLFTKDIDHFDKERIIPNELDISKYSYHIYNVITIARNIVNSYISKDKIGIVNSKTFIDVLLSEINLINELYALTDCKVVFLIPTYDKVLKNYNINKESNNTKHVLEYIALNSIVSKLRLDTNYYNVIVGYKIPNLTGEILITTSYTVDLLNKVNLNLLESHTGVLKSKSMFNSKYYPVGTTDITNMPVVEELLYILGDHTIIRPTKITIRRLLVELMVSKNWSTRTTREKVIHDISSVPELKFAIKDFHRMYL